jgi:hypothetical protein
MGTDAEARSLGRDSGNGDDAGCADLSVRVNACDRYQLRVGIELTRPALFSRSQLLWHVHLLPDYRRKPSASWQILA